MSDRIARLQTELETEGFDAVVLNPSSTLHYLTGRSFDSHERLFLLAVPRSGVPFVVLPQLEEHNWRASVPEVERLFLWDDADGPDEAAGKAFANLTTAKKVAVEPLALRFFEYSHLRRHLPQAEIVSAEPLVQALRLHKQADEVEKLRGAVRIAEETLEEIVASVRVGMTEQEIAGRLAAGLLLRGGGGISFGPIVLSGPKSALPHGEPNERQIQAGELLLLDFGTSYQGYHSDITRTFVVGAEPDDQTRKVYEAVRAANAAGCAACRPGVTVSEVHHICQADLHGPQWEKYYKHRTGHGLGLEIHEPPSVMAGSQVELEEGMVFTVEPGLYLEGWGGVRIEDDLVVTADGAESLTTYPRELRVIGKG